MSTKKLAPLAAGFVLALQLAATGQAATATSAFPVTLTTGAGRVTLTSRPARIVSLSSTGTEDLFAIGAGPQVVAVDSQSLLPKKAPNTSLSAFSPNAEAIAAYRPDLVIVAFDQDKIVAQLGKLHIPVLLEGPALNLNGVYSQLEQLGTATGHLAQAKALVTRLRGRVAAIVRSIRHRGKQISVYHEIDSTHYTATSHTFIGSIYKLLGLRNIADAAGKTSNYPQLSAEYIIRADPDLIVLADTSCCRQTQATVARRPGWKTITAVREHQIVAVPDVEASYWGPNVVAFMQTIADHIRAISRA